MAKLSDSNSDNNLVPFTTKPSHAKQYFGSFVACMGSMCIGTVMGYTSPAGDLLHHPTNHSGGLNLTDTEYDWFTSVPFLGGAAGGMLGGVLVNTLGRKMTMMATTMLFMVGWGIIGGAQNFPMLLTGRLVTGVSVGITGIVSPNYIAEIASPDIRGALGSGFQMMFTVGMVYGLGLGIFIHNWRILAAVSAVPPVIQLVLLFFVKESPVFLLAKGKIEKMTDSLQYFRGANYDIQQEVNDMQLEQDEAVANKTSITSLFRKPYIMPLFVSIIAFLFQQASGNAAVLSNLSAIFQASGSTMDDNVAAMIVGAVQMGATVIAILLVDRAGRKVLLVISSVAMALSLVAMGEYFGAQSANSEWTAQNLGWLPLVSLIVYITAYSIGFGPIPWILMSELFAPSVKDAASSIASTLNWIFAFSITLGFQPLEKLLGDPGLYLLLAFNCLVALVYSAWMVPETKGLTLQQITAYFTTSNPPSVSLYDKEEGKGRRGRDTDC